VERETEYETVALKKSASEIENKCAKQEEAFSKKKKR